MKNFGCDFEFTVLPNQIKEMVNDPELEKLKKAQEETKKLEEISELQRNISNAKRSVFITLKNNTKNTFNLSQHKLFSGDWLCQPTEVLPPNGMVEFGSKNTEAMNGTSGIVQYGFTEGKSDIKISWDNPFFEKSVFNKYSPVNFKIETKKSVNRNNAILIYEINENVEEEKEKDLSSNNNFIESLMFRIFSYNTHLFPPGQNVIDDPIRRSKLISDSINKSVANELFFCRGNFDIICLQDVYYNPCKEILEENLKSDFPHIATR